MSAGAVAVEGGARPRASVNQDAGAGTGQPPPSAGPGYDRASDQDTTTEIHIRPLHKPRHYFNPVLMQQ
ncbi:unnamed protein product [Urochloa humidicola]